MLTNVQYQGQDHLPIDSGLGPRMNPVTLPRAHVPNEQISPGPNPNVPLPSSPTIGGTGNVPGSGSSAPGAWNPAPGGNADNGVTNPATSVVNNNPPGTTNTGGANGRGPTAGFNGGSGGAAGVGATKQPTDNGTPPPTQTPTGGTPGSTNTGGSGGGGTTLDPFEQAMMDMLAANSPSNTSGNGVGFLPQLSTPTTTATPAANPGSQAIILLLLVAAAVVGYFLWEKYKGKIKNKEEGKEE